MVKQYDDLKIRFWEVFEKGRESVCVCVYVYECVCVRERERAKNKQNNQDFLSWRVSIMTHHNFDVTSTASP